MEYATIELRHLRYFIAVAEQLNFSRAAEALSTAQPSLSQQIRQLEAEIGVDLFARDKRRIALTPAGEEFLGDARALLAQLNVAVAHAREAGRGLRGELRIAFTVSTMMSFLPAAIRAYRADHRDVRITLLASTNISTVEALERREADVGVMLAPRDLSLLENIESQAIGSVALGVVVPEGHRLARRDEIALPELGNENLILYARKLGDIHDFVLSLCHERGFVPGRIEEVDRIEALLGLVAAGEGVSIVPRLYETLKFPGVAYAGLSPAAKPFAMIVARSKDTNSALTTAFAETCQRVAKTIGI